MPPILRFREPTTNVCFLWPEWPATDLSQGGTTRIASVRAGGNYRITSDAKAYLAENQYERFAKRIRITMWLVEQRLHGVGEPEITVEAIQSSDEGTRTPIEEAIFKLLKHLAWYGDIGDPIELRDDRDLELSNDESLSRGGSSYLSFAPYAMCLAVSECHDWNDLGVYMDELRQRGYVRMSSIPGQQEWNRYSVTYQGHQAAKGHGDALPNPPSAATLNQNPTHIPNLDSKEVFVIHGRNETARVAMFEFLRAVGLEPIEWDTAVKATESASPYIGQILDVAFERANAAISLMTPDDNAVLKEWLQREDDPQIEKALTGQARPNVLFETGMAMARFQEKTIIVEVGDPKRFSDIAGRHTIRLSDTVSCRESLVQRLETAGCPVDRNRPDWQLAGDFKAAITSVFDGRGDDDIQDLDPRGDGELNAVLDRLNDKAKELLAKAARGEGYDQGFIDDYRYRAGGTSISRPDTPKAIAEFQEATEQLLRFELATRREPQHMNDRRGFLLTNLGYQVAELLI